MKTSRQKGMFTIRGERGAIQVYYPSGYFNSHHFSIQLDTRFRYASQGMYVCAGFCILGFGFGIDYELKNQMLEPIQKRDEQS